MENIGGVGQIIIIPESNVLEMPDAADGLLLGSVLTVNSSKVYNFSYTYETARFKEKSQNALLHEYEVSAVLARDSLSHRNALQVLDAEKHLVFIRDHNWNERLLGDVGNACRFSSSLDSGRKTADRNGYEIGFTWQSRERAFFVTDDSEDDPLTEVNESEVVESDVVTPSGGDTVRKVAIKDERYIVMVLNWRESGSWRGGMIRILRNDSLQLYFEEDALASAPHTQLNPRVRINGNYIELMVNTRLVDTFKYNVIVRS